ncbi:MAG: MFS transporter [Bacteroidales bacterium]|nr:MFS transporter [Bacteroidales bacterium]
MMKSGPAEKVNRGILLVVIMLSSFFNPFMGSAVNIALPSIGDELSMNAVSLSWIAMSFLLSSATLLVPFGKLADIIGRRKMLLWGNLFFVLATFLCSLSFTGTMLVTSRFLQGIGSAMMLSSSMAIVITAFPHEIRGRIIGLNTMAVYVGLSAAPWLGGILTQHLGWRSIFYTNGIAGLLVILGILFGVRAEWAEARNDRFDFKGSLVYVTSMLALMYGFSKLPGNLAVGLTVVGVVGLASFIVIEQRVQFPVLSINLFSNNRIFAFSNLAALINYAATFGITFVLSLYLQNIKGLTPGDAGFLLMTQPVLMAITASVSGRLSDRIDSRILSSLGMAVIVVGLLLMIFLKTGTSDLYLIISLIVLGFGFGLFSAPNTNSVMSSVGKKHLGVASATLGTMRATGQMFSMAIAAMAIHVFIGDAQISIQNALPFMKSLRIIFLIFAILCFFGIFASLARGKKEANSNS